MGLDNYVMMERGSGKREDLAQQNPSRAVWPQCPAKPSSYKSKTNKMRLDGIFGLGCEILSKKKK